MVSVIISEGATSIGNYTFDGCSNLASVIIPKSVTCIGGRAFGSCSSLTSVTIPEGVTSIGEWAFGSCSSLASVTIREGVTSIGGGAFKSCRALTSIYSFNPVPPTTDHSFGDYKNATLYVPKKALEAYKKAIEWRKFQNIQGIDSAGISGIEADGNGGADVYYDMGGRRLHAPKKGLNIINGKKTIVR